MPDDRRRDDDRRAHFDPDRLETPRWADRPDWGGVARRGAFQVDPDRHFRADRRLEERRAKDRVKPESEPDAGLDDGDPLPAPEPDVEEWILESVEVEGRRTPRRTRDRAVGNEATTVDHDLRDFVSGRITGAVNTAGIHFGDTVSSRRADRLRGRLNEAARAFERERYGDAAAVLRPIAEEVPRVAEVRELLGLTYYRQGRWINASRELRAFNELTGSTEQHAVLADCARALGRHGQAQAYWDALRAAAPDPGRVAEGRIVMAGSLADRGHLSEAIELLEAAHPWAQDPTEADLRTGYVLADLHERAGDFPAARSGFAWLDRRHPDFADVHARLEALD